MAQVAFSAPHYRAAEIGLDVLKQGGCAVDAMIAAAAAISVLYPHMNSVGGDGFWIIQRAGESPIAIDASGNAALTASPQWYRQQLSESTQTITIPQRGPLAALTVAGTIAGWQLARQIQQTGHGKSQTTSLASIATLLSPAIELAQQGIEVTQSLQNASEKTFSELSTREDFANIFLPEQRALQRGECLRNPRLANLLEQLSREGLDSFYRGEVGDCIAKYLTSQGSPLQLRDLQQFHADALAPLQVKTSRGSLFNTDAPTQGVASLIILALYDRLYQSDWNETERVHHLLECIKQAFITRNRFVSDRSRLDPEWSSLLTDRYLDQLAKNIDAKKALPWPHVAEPGDTVWMGAVDKDGTMVSFIQSIYWEFGSGVVIPDLGLVWNNRGINFTLDEGPKLLAPGLKPFHTLNPALAQLSDGRRLSYGCMGGEGQPQTQAALFTRYVYQQWPLEKAIASGRWLLGRTWGKSSDNTKLEADLAEEIGENLRMRGHDIEVVAPCNELMGHAGAICLDKNGVVEAASDPRSDGAAVVAEVGLKIG